MVRIEMEGGGVIELELYADKAPITVENFENLVKEGFYDGLIFHHVIAGFMRNWDSMLNNDFLGNPDFNSDVCPQEKDYQDAVKVAEKLGIEIKRVDFKILVRRKNL